MNIKQGTGFRLRGCHVAIVAALALAAVIAAAGAEIRVLVAEILGLIALVIAARSTLLVLTGLVVGNHAEIVIGELQVIFHLHAVAIVVGVLRELLVLFEQLRGIAACAAVDPVELVAVAALRAITAPAATVIAIVIQGNCSLISDRLQKMPACTVNRPLALAPHRWALPTCASRSALMWPWACPDGRFS